MAIITIQTDGQRLLYRDAPLVAAQGVKEDYVAFEFDSSWDGFAKTALFYKEAETDNVYTSVVSSISGNRALVPWEVTDEEGTIYIGVYGVKDDIILTSEVLPYTIKKGVYTEGSQSKPPTPGIYEQVVKIAGQIQDLYNQEKNERINSDSALSTSINTAAARIDNFLAENPTATGVAKKLTTVYLWTTARDASYSPQAIAQVIVEKTTGSLQFDPESIVEVKWCYKIDSLSSSVPSGRPVGYSKRTYNLQYLPDKTSSGGTNYSRVVCSLNQNTIDFDDASYKCYVCFEVTYLEDSTLTELVDARVGYDGTVYNSLGSAIRVPISNEIQDRKTAIDKTISKIDGLADNAYSTVDIKNDIDFGIGQIDTTTGNINTNIRSTAYSPILTYDRPVILSADSGHQTSVYLYENNGVDRYYGRWFGVHDEIPISAGIKFRVQFRRSDYAAWSNADYDHIHVDEVHSSADIVWSKGNLNTKGTIEGSSTGGKVMLKPYPVKVDTLFRLSENKTTYYWHISISDDRDPYSVHTITWDADSEIVVPAGKWVYFCVYRRDHSDISIDEIKQHLLIKDNTANERIDGVLTDIASVRNRVIALEETNSIPSYFTTHIENKVSTINTLRNNLTNGTQFLFITDVHINAYNSSKHGKSLITYVCENTLITDVFNGGDVANGGYANHLDKVKFSQAVKKGIEYCIPDWDVNNFFIAGNHDLGWDYNGQGGSAGAIITADDLYTFCGLKKLSGVIRQDKNCKFNYVYQDDEKKFYYVVCTGNLRDVVTGQSYTSHHIWFVNALKDCPGGYTIIVFNHIVLNNPDSGITSYASTMLDVCDTYNDRGVTTKYGGNDATVVDYSTSGGTVACFVGGHTHFDWDSTSPGGIPVIVTTCDNYGGESVNYGMSGRSANTITENAFDVFTVDTASRTITVTRIGAGSDRNFNY